MQRTDLFRCAPGTSASSKHLPSSPAERQLGVGGWWMADGGWQRVYFPSSLCEELFVYLLRGQLPKNSPANRFEVKWKN